MKERMDAELERLRQSIRERPIAWFGGALAASLLVGLVIGVIAGATDTSDLESERDDLATQLGDVEAELADVELERDEVAGQVDDARERARNAYREAKKRAASEMDTRKSRLDRREEDLDQRENRLDERAADLDQAEQRQAQRVISEDGIWQAGEDFEPGTYRSTGSRGCYWAKLSAPSGDFDDLIANGTGANQTVTIDSPWFETKRCGEWQMIGG